MGTRRPHAASVTLTTAKAHLRITTPVGGRGRRRQYKLDQAEGIIRNYLKSGALESWVSPETAPASVTAAILLMLTHLFEHRGDAPPEIEADEQLWAEIDRFVIRYRDPAMA